MLEKKVDEIIKRFFLSTENRILQGLITDSALLLFKLIIFKRSSLELLLPFFVFIINF